jgi:hypothetical protein
MRRSKDVSLTLLTALALSTTACDNRPVEVRNCVDTQGHIVPDFDCQEHSTGGGGGGYHYIYGGASGGRNCHRIRLAVGSTREAYALLLRIFQYRTLRFQQLLDAAAGVIHHLKHAGPCERSAFGGRLHFDEAAVFGHDDIHVDFGL